MGHGGMLQRNLLTGVTGPAFPFSFDIEVLNRRLEWQHNVQVAKPLLLTGGYQLREQQGENIRIAPDSKLLSSHARFAQAQINYQERILMTAGVRHDSYNVFGDATTYRVTGGYRVLETGTKIRGSYATSFRAPTLNQLFFPGFGNPNLQPEKSKSFDVGIDQWLLKDRLQLSAGYFWNRFENLILSVQVAPALFQAQNIGQAKSQGWETGLQCAVTDNFAVRGQYTYTLTRDLVTARRLPRWPIHTASAGFSYQPIQPVQIHADFRYVGVRFDDTRNVNKLGAFDVLNVALTYDASERVQFFGRIENLYNQQYEEI